MSLLNSALANSVGVLWRAASGTVDPWTKANIVDENASGLVQASGGTISASQARTQAASDATATLSTFPGGGADPSQFWAGVKNSVAQFNPANWSNKTILVSALIVIAGVTGLVFFLRVTSRA